MALTPWQRMAAKRGLRGAITKNLWPGGVFPYAIDPKLVSLQFFLFAK